MVRTMAYQQNLLTIKNMNSDVIAELLQKNGYNNCSEVVKEKNLNGEMILEVSEFQLRSLGLPSKTSRNLWECISVIKRNPEQFLTPKQNISKPKPNITSNNPHRIIRAALESTLKPKTIAVDRISINSSSKVLEDPLESYVCMTKPTDESEAIKSYYDVDGYLKATNFAKPPEDNYEPPPDIMRKKQEVTPRHRRNSSDSSDKNYEPSPIVVDDINYINTVTNSFPKGNHQHQGNITSEFTQSRRTEMKFSPMTKDHGLNGGNISNSHKESIEVTEEIYEEPNDNSISPTSASNRYENFNLKSTPLTTSSESLNLRNDPSVKANVKSPYEIIKTFFKKGTRQDAPDENSTEKAAFYYPNREAVLSESSEVNTVKSSTSFKNRPLPNIPSKEIVRNTYLKVLDVDDVTTSKEILSERKMAPMNNIQQIRLNEKGTSHSPKEEAGEMNSYRNEVRDDLMNRKHAMKSHRLMRYEIGKNRPLPSLPHDSDEEWIHVEKEIANPNENDLVLYENQSIGNRQLSSVTSKPELVKKPNIEDTDDENASAVYENQSSIKKNVESFSNTIPKTSKPKHNEKIRDHNMRSSMPEAENQGPIYENSDNVILPKEPRPKTSVLPEVANASTSSQFRAENSAITFEEKIAMMAEKLKKELRDREFKMEAKQTGTIAKTKEANNQNTLPAPPYNIPRISQIEATCNANVELNLNNEAFYRNTDQKGAIALLQDLPEGAFVFRRSRHSLTTLVIKHELKYFAVQIKRLTNNMICLSENEELQFRTLEDLITHFQRTPLTLSYKNRVVLIYLNRALPSDRF